MADKQTFHRPGCLFYELKQLLRAVESRTKLSWEQRELTSFNFFYDFDNIGSAINVHHYHRLHDKTLPVASSGFETISSLYGGGVCHLYLP